MDLSRPSEGERRQGRHDYCRASAAARTDDLAGNEAICDNLQPGLHRDYKVLYEVPVDATITHIAIWDSDDPDDPSGNESVIRFARR